jgi:hypothetical protein
MGVNKSNELCSEFTSKNSQTNLLSDRLHAVKQVGDITLMPLLAPCPRLMLILIAARLGVSVQR